MEWDVVETDRKMRFSEDLKESGGLLEAISLNVIRNTDTVFKFPLSV